MGYLEEFIKKHEGIRLKVYKDTAGHATIGYGRNLDRNGISLDEAEIMLRNDIDKVIRHIAENAWYRNLSQPRQFVIVDMCFNMGVAGVLAFEDMVNAIAIGNFDKAADAMLASKWAVANDGSLKHRAVEDATIMRSDKLP